MVFTARDIYNYLKYEKVRSGGHYNMFAEDAQEATALEIDDYTFVMKNYYDLSSQAKELDIEFLTGVCGIEAGSGHYSPFAFS
jgi:hypothetical protein